MEKGNKKNEYITRIDLEEQTQVLLTALDTRLVKMEFGLGEKIDAVRVELKHDIKNVNDELYIIRDELKHDINNVQTLIDGYVKAQEDFRQEFVIMKEELKQIKKVIKEKLGLEIKTA